MKADKKYFYKNLKYLREISKTSQQQLADYLKVDRSTISRWENNEMDATIGYAIDISTYFDIPINYLLCYDIQNEEKISVEQVIEEVKIALNKPGIESDKIDYLKSTLNMLEKDK